MLSITNSLYDPLGFVAPVVVEARLIYSAVCQTKIGWDEVIDSVNLKRWTSWKSSIQQLKNVRIPRCFKPNIQYEMERKFSNICFQMLLL